jgi:HTH domain found in ParB protein
MTDSQPEAVVIPTYEVSLQRRRESLGKLEKMRPRTEIEKWDGTFEQWQERGTALSKNASDHQWEVAEWVARGDRAFRSKAYDAAEALTGYSRATLQQYASVYRGCFIRIKELSFGHHQVVAALPSELQKKALEYAVEHNLSVAGLRRAVKKALSPPTPENSEETRTLTVTLSKDEYMCIKQWGSACGISESEIARQVLFDWYKLGGLGLPAHLRGYADDD